MAAHKRPETPHRHNLHGVLDERRAETRLEVAEMRQRVDQFEANRRVRLLSGKFNRLQQQATTKAAARTHWLDSVKPWVKGYQQLAAEASLVIIAGVGSF